MTCKPAKTKSKTFAVAAAIATAIILMQTPAEARRHKHKVLRHHVTATAPTGSFGLGIFGAGNQYAHPAYGVRAARVSRIARGGRHWRSVRRSAPQGSRAGHQSFASVAPMAGIGSSSVVAQARRYLGTNPTGMGALWCARFMNMVLEQSGRRGTGSNMASSFANYGRRVAGPQVGAIAVMSRGAEAAMSGSCRGSTGPAIRSSFPAIITAGWASRFIRAAAFMPM